MNEFEAIKICLNYGSVLNRLWNGGRRWQYSNLHLGFCMTQINYCNNSFRLRLKARFFMSQKSRLSPLNWNEITFSCEYFPHWKKAYLSKDMNSM